MPLFRRNRAIQKTDKHEVTFTQLSEDASAGTTIVIAQGVDVGAKTGSFDVAVGSHIPWVYCEFNFSAETITNAKTVHWTVRILPPTAVASGANTLYADDRSYVIKRGMDMLVKDISVVYKHMFSVKIPKVYQRMKQGMDILFQYKASSTQTMNSCGIFVYKELY